MDLAGCRVTDFEDPAPSFLLIFGLPGRIGYHIESLMVCTFMHAVVVALTSMALFGLVLGRFVFLGHLDYLVTLVDLLNLQEYSLRQICSELTEF